MSGVNVNAIFFSFLYLGVLIIVIGLAYYISMKTNESNEENNEGSASPPQRSSNPVLPEPEYADVREINMASRTERNDPESVTYAAVDTSKKTKKSKKEYTPKVPPQAMELTEYATISH